MDTLEHLIETIEDCLLDDWFHEREPVTWKKLIKVLKRAAEPKPDGPDVGDGPEW